MVRFGDFLEGCRYGHVLCHGNGARIVGASVFPLHELPSVSRCSGQGDGCAFFVLPFVGTECYIALPLGLHSQRVVVGLGDFFKGCRYALVAGHGNPPCCIGRTVFPASESPSLFGNSGQRNLCAFLIVCLFGADCHVALSYGLHVQRVVNRVSVFCKGRCQSFVFGDRNLSDCSLVAV